MEPVTHLLYGACLSRSGFNRLSALATPVMVVAAEIPDLDIVTSLGGPVYGFQHHRGATHTLLGVPFDAAAAVLIVFSIHRLRSARGDRARPTRPGPNWAALYGLACIAALSHILLDFTNSYGVRPLMPFSYRWHHWDIVSIVDPVMLGLLILALVLPSLFGLIQEEIGSRRRGPRGRAAALAALILIAALWAVRDFEHRRALGALDAREYGSELPRRISAYATPLNIFSWNGVVETDTAYHVVPVDSLSPEVDPRRQERVFYRPAETPVLAAARQSYLGKVFLDWADYPVFEVRPAVPGEELEELSGIRAGTRLALASFSALQPADALQPPNTGYMVRMFDLRYFDPESIEPGRRRILGGTVQLDRSLHPVAYSMPSFFGRAVQRARGGG
ncbi:MAG: metal-dependent hydrolase [Acidobacteria bacterium]|nr:metal-dependent hydrolase [Acidobacteriota bacterium]